ncbi:hypothetical protein CPC08DRAFT_713348 [Agrocybe pediades]|nr:hypothetical protein CPC08DRAFT_713348 [Agrocybe pediades]
MDGTHTLGETSKSSTVTQHTFQDLPNELALAIFSLLELKSYIVLHGVCKKWKQLLPSADIHPIRRRMFNLFHHMLQHPRFPETRQWTLKNLRPFDRKAYIDGLLSKYRAVPDEFRLWILEWPARMVPFGMWPGLPFACHQENTLDEAYGMNYLAYRMEDNSPGYFKVLHRHPSQEDRWLPALLFWKINYGASWLIFEHGDPDVFGRVMVSGDEVLHYFVLTMQPLAPGEAEHHQTYRDWLVFREHTWDKQIAMALANEEKECIGSSDIEPLL